MDTIKAAKKIIREGILLLPDEAKGDFKAQAGEIFIDEAISNAMAAANGDDEKTAMLRAYAVQEANRMASTLWRLRLITDNCEAEYRKLPSMQEMAAEYNKFVDERKAKMDKIMEDHKAIAEEEKELDIFKGIVNGVPAKEAKRKYKEFQNRQQQALAGAR